MGNIQLCCSSNSNAFRIQTVSQYLANVSNGFHHMTQKYAAVQVIMIGCRLRNDYNYSPERISLPQLPLGSGTTSAHSRLPLTIVGLQIRCVLEGGCHVTASVTYTPKANSTRVLTYREKAMQMQCWGLAEAYRCCKESTSYIFSTNTLENQLHHP